MLHSTCDKRGTMKQETVDTLDIDEDSDETLSYFSKLAEYGNLNCLQKVLQPLFWSTMVFFYKYN